MFGRAILAREAVQTPDVSVDPEHFASSATTAARNRCDHCGAAAACGHADRRHRAGRDATGRLLRDSQVELLQTFAEQAVIAIGSAETYRELQARTAALAARNSEYGERIEQQSATIDVLKVMSASPGDAQPVFDLIVERARGSVCRPAATAAGIRR